MLSLLRRLTKSTPRPDLTLEVAELGLLRYDYEQNAWIGSVADRHFGLSSRRGDQPTPVLLDYAIRAIKAPGWLDAETAIAKRAAIDEYPREATEEIEQLNLGFVLLYQKKNRCYLIADLEGGHDFRAWRIEFRDRTCEGIGFDT